MQHGRASGASGHPGGDGIGESLSDDTAPVAVKVVGDDLDALDTAAEKIVAIQFKRQSGIPARSIQRLPHALAASGLKSPGRARHVAPAGTEIHPQPAQGRRAGSDVLHPERRRVMAATVAQLSQSRLNLCVAKL
jgi:hypothetical protein